MNRAAMPPGGARLAGAGAILPPPTERLGSWTTKLFVLLLFVALSLGMTWPLALNLRTAVPGPPWDNFVWLYDLWWFRHSIVDLGQWPTLNSTIFYPFGYDLRLSETMLANKALIAPLLFWGDEVLAYNALLLISFVLTGYATYLLIAYLTGNPYAAVIGGAILAFSPYRMHAMAAGWLPLISTQWIPWTFLYLERTLREGAARHALAAGFFLALSFLSSWYYLYIVGAFALLYLLLRAWSLRGTWRWGPLLRNLALVGGVIALMIAPVAWPVISTRSGEMGWSLSDVEKWAASAEDFVLPNVYHPLWGDAVLRVRGYTLRYPWYAPGFVYLGVVALLLAALAARRNGNAREVAPPVRAYFWLGVISLVLALGVVLHWNNEVLELPVSPGVEAFFARAMSTLMSKWALHRASYYELTFRSGTVPVPLPGLLLYLFVPLGNAVRTFYRFGVVTIFAVAVLAGVGISSFLNGRGLRNHPFRSLLVTTVVLGLVLGDFCSAPLAYGLSEVKPQPLDRWLAAQPDDVVVMQFPLVRALSGDSLYRTRYHGKRVAYGHGTFYPAAYRDALDVLGSFPSAECLDLLKAWGVNRVVVGSQAYDAGWGDKWSQTWESVRREIEASPRLRPLGTLRDEPFWRDERVSALIYGSPPVVPVLVDQVYVYELR